MSLFTEALRDLLDETNLFTRKEWAEFLFVKVIGGPPRESGEERINKWLTEEGLPRSSDLSMICIALEESSDVTKEPLEKFKQMANIPARKVSKFGKRMLPTVWEYMNRPLFCDLSNRLAKLTFAEQEQLLDAEFPE